MDEYIPDFLVETAKALVTLNKDLVRLGASPDDARPLGRMFRTFHSIKGTSGFLGLSRLGQVCHAGETVLSQMRDGALYPAPHVISALTQSVDVIKNIVDRVEATGSEGAASDEALIAEMNALLPEGSPLDAYAPSVGPDDLQALFDATPGPLDAQPAAPTVRAPPRLERDDAEQTCENPPPKGDFASHRTMRLQVDLIEELMAAVSELDVNRNQLLQILHDDFESPFSGPLRRLSVITSELQASVMHIRMQPIGEAWSILPRAIRELSRELGKKIDLVMEGADTELERQILELIKDPLVHIVRNAADHGVEMPVVRSASGKSETGQVRLSASQEDDRIVIRISDDGRGLDAAKIRRKAVESGLATSAQAARMSDASIFRFILRPGFSTATHVTTVSGRGVGMDIVKTNIERIGGTIEIESQPNLGTTFIITIPQILENGRRISGGRNTESALSPAHFQSPAGRLRLSGHAASFS